MVLVHGVGTRTDLTLPVSLAAIGAGTALMISFVPVPADVLDRAGHAMLDRLAARTALISLFSAVSNESAAAPATATGSLVTLQIISHVAEARLRPFHSRRFRCLGGADLRRRHPGCL
jgi:hypothetical protein